MYRFIERATRSTPSARPDLMPLGGVLLALMAIFATQVPQASKHFTQNNPWVCGKCFDCDVPREIEVSQDRHGQVRFGSDPVSIPMLHALLQIEQAQPDVRTMVNVNSDPDVEYGQVVALISQIQTAGIPSHRIRLFH